MLLLHFGSALLLLLSSLQLSAADERPVVRSREVFFREAETSRDDFPEVADNAQVDIFYMEYVLTSWMLEGSSWNAYHSGIGFLVREPLSGGMIQKKYHVEFIPRMTDQVRHVLLPDIQTPPKRTSWMPQALHNFLSWWNSDYVLTWNNEGGVFFHAHWPTKYTNQTRIGRTNGTVFNQMRPWFFDYQEKYRTFEPVEIISPQGEVLHPSHLCHDLFHHAIGKFHELGFKPEPEEPIFRDHIVLFSNKMQRVNYTESKIAVSRFYRLYESFIEMINKEFSNVRSLFLGAYLLTVTPYLYKDGEYYELEIGSPYVNYCYMEVVMPPGKSVPFFKNEKLCALGDHTADAAKTFLGHLTFQHVVFLLERLILDTRVWAAMVGGFLVYRQLFTTK